MLPPPPPPSAQSKHRHSVRWIAAAVSQSVSQLVSSSVVSFEGGGSSVFASVCNRLPSLLACCILLFSFLRFSPSLLLTARLKPPNRAPNTLPHHSLTPRKRCIPILSAGVSLHLLRVCSVFVFFVSHFTLTVTQTRQQRTCDHCLLDEWMIQRLFYLLFSTGN